MTNGDGIQYTVKEMLAQIDGKITMLGQKLDQKADRSAVHDMKSELAALSLVAVRQDGPLVGKVNEHGRRLTEVERELDKRLAVIDRINEKADISYVNGIKEDVHELAELIGKARQEFGDKFGGVQKALYTAALSTAGGALLFSLTLFAIFR